MWSDLEELKRIRGHLKRFEGQLARPIEEVEEEASNATSLMEFYEPPPEGVLRGLRSYSVALFERLFERSTDLLHAARGMIRQKARDGEDFCRAMSWYHVSLSVWARTVGDAEGEAREVALATLYEAIEQVFAAQRSASLSKYGEAHDLLLKADYLFRYAMSHLLPEERRERVVRAFNRKAIERVFGRA
jgi:hypothetical protein